MFPTVASIWEIVRESSISALFKVRTYEKLVTETYSNHEMLLKFSKSTRKTFAWQGHFHKECGLRLSYDYLMIL